MYDDFETVLMETLSTILGSELSLEAKAAWRAIFPAIFAEMKDGGSSVYIPLPHIPMHHTLGPTPSYCVFTGWPKQPERTDVSRVRIHSQNA